MSGVLGPAHQAGDQTAVLNTHEGEDEAAMWVCRFSLGDPGGWGVHFHRQHQIAWVSQGQSTAIVGDGRWTLSPTRAMWIPGGFPHDLVNRRDSLLHCLYIWPEHSPVEWDEPTVLAVTPLARELLLRLGEPGMEMAVSLAGTTMLFDQLEPLSFAGVTLPMPTDDRAIDLARELIARPSDNDTLEQWARRLATSASTLRRAFVTGTGLTFTDWRTQARLQAALPMLHDGSSVATVAARVGYASTSGFVDAFRKHFGHAPSAVRGAGRQRHIA